MEWIEISILADGEAAEAVSELFNRLNRNPDGQGGAVTELTGFDPIGEMHRPVMAVRTYLPADLPDTGERQRRIEEGLWHLARLYSFGEPQLRRLAEQDWAHAWKAHYRPLRIGRRFLVVPAWLRAEVGAGPDDLPLVLDPGLAFGTGLHPSTQLCLIAMEQMVRPGQAVLDAGCGSGILSIAAARLGAAGVDAFDVDPVAVEATRQNAALNDLPTPIRPFVSGGPGDGPFWEGHRWDVILVNILPHVIRSLLAEGLGSYLAPEGHMVLAGIIEAREDEVKGVLDCHGLRVIQRDQQDDWVSLVAEHCP